MLQLCFHRDDAHSTERLRLASLIETVSITPRNQEDEQKNTKEQQEEQSEEKEQGLETKGFQVQLVDRISLAVEGDDTR